MLDRRYFLIGAGALLTASFVNRAKAFSRKSGEPLVLSPARKPEETSMFTVRRYGATTAASGACRAGLTNRSRLRLRPGVSIYAHSDIPSIRMTRSSAHA